MLLHLSLFDHFYNFSRGVIDTQDVAFFTLFVGLLPLPHAGNRSACASGAGSADMPSRRSPCAAAFGRHAMLLALQIVLAAVAVRLLLVLAERHNRRFDLTPTQSFVLSDEARQVVAKACKFRYASSPSTMRQEHGQRRQMEDLLQLFADASPQDHLPPAGPRSLTGAGQEIRHRQLQHRRARRRTASSTSCGASTRRKSPTRCCASPAASNACLCFITGHGEHNPQDPSDRTGYSEVAKALEKEGFDIRTLQARATTPASRPSARPCSWQARRKICCPEKRSSSHATSTTPDG